MDIFESSKKLLTSNDKQKIENLYRELKANPKVGVHLKSAISGVKHKLARLECSDNRHQNALVNMTKSYTFCLLNDGCNDKYLKKLALISIAYLCDPFDVIPDSNPNLGYVDDVYMFSLSLREIKKINLKMYDEITTIFGKLNAE